jgi:selenocysteine-specific elongation factor
MMQAVGLERDTAVAALQELHQTNQIYQFDQQLISRQGVQRLTDQLDALLSAHHRQYPLRLGMPREEVRSRLKLKPALFTPLVAHWTATEVVVEAGALLRLPSHAIQFSPAQQSRIDALVGRFAHDPVNTPSVKECREAVGDDVYFALIDLQQLRPISSDVVYTPDGYAQVMARVMDFLQANGRINAAQTRDLLTTSRKYAIALLEHLDEQKITRRVGDDRELV